MNHMVKIEFLIFLKKFKGKPCNIKNYSVIIVSI